MLFIPIIALVIGVMAGTSEAVDKLPPFSQYEVIEERNIFMQNPLRKSIKTIETVSSEELEVSGSEFGGYVLSGMVVLRGKYKAIITDTSTQKGFYVGLYDKIGDYIVSDIKKDTVFIEKDGQVYQLKLDSSNRRRKSKLLPKVKKKEILVEDKTELIKADDSFKTRIIESIRRGIPHFKR